MADEVQDKTLFRAPVEEKPPAESEKHDKSSETNIHTPDSVEHTPSVYKETHDRPYLADLLQLGEAYTHFDMETLTKETDDFIQSEIKRRNLTDDRETYNKLVDEMTKKLNLPEGIDQYTKMEQLHKLAMIHKKMVDAMLEREKLLEADPTTLTSSQLKKRIEDGTK
jgi:hypothetical protein